MKNMYLKVIGCSCYTCLPQSSPATQNAQSLPGRSGMFRSEPWDSNLTIQAQFRSDLILRVGFRSGSPDQTRVQRGTGGSDPSDLDLRAEVG